MLIVSMSVSTDGFIRDRAGDFSWTPPDDETFRWHLAGVEQLGAYALGRKLYEDMRVWHDPAMRGTPDRARFADVWMALPKLVFSRTAPALDPSARLATRPVVDELRDLLAEVHGDVQIGGATLAGQAIEAGLVDEFRLLRHPIVVGGGTPLFPAVADPIRLELVEVREFGGGVVLERHRRRSA
jgi:dihydrofolate reductase